MRKIGWYDVKTKFKHIIRSFFYSAFAQGLLCLLVSSYIRFVILTSSKKFYNLEYIDDLIKKGDSLIVAAWHNRLAMTAFIFSKSRKINKDYVFSALTSDHGDGKIVGKIMENFGLKVINGSTRKGNDPKKGIAIGNFRKIFKTLNKSAALCITPDGPRGPRFKVGGQVASISKISGAPVIPVSYGISRRKVFGSWDRFILPLPFSKVVFYFGEPIYVAKDSSEEELTKINNKIEKGINLVCKNSDELAGSTWVN